MRQILRDRVGGVLDGGETVRRMRAHEVVNLLEAVWIDARRDVHQHERRERRLAARARGGALRQQNRDAAKRRADGDRPVAVPLRKVISHLRCIGREVLEPVRAVLDPGGIAVPTLVHGDGHMTSARDLRGRALPGVARLAATMQQQDRRAGRAVLIGDELIAVRAGEGERQRLAWTIHARAPRKFSTPCL